MIECDEDQLLARWVAAKDEEALSRLVERYRPMVTSVCQRILRRSGDAEDAIQETFIALADRGSTITGSIGGWLRVVATHCAMAQIRAQQRRRIRALSPHLAEPSCDLDDTDTIDACVAELTEAERELIIRLFYLGETQASIARVNRQSRLQVHRRLQTILGRLRSLALDRGLKLAPAALLLLLSGGSQAVAAEATSGPGLLARHRMALGVVALVMSALAVVAVLAWRDQQGGGQKQQGLGSIAQASRLDTGMQLGGGIPGQYAIEPVPIQQLELAVIPRARGGGLEPVVLDNWGNIRFGPLADSPHAQALRVQWHDGSESLGLLLDPPAGQDLVLRQPGSSADAVLLAIAVVEQGVVRSWRVERQLYGSLDTSRRFWEKTELARSDAHPLTCTWGQTDLRLLQSITMRTDRPTLILGLAFVQMTNDERTALRKRHLEGGRGERIIAAPDATVR